MTTKGIKIIMWICIAVLTFQFLGAGMTKLLGSWSVRFSAWGYPLAFMYVIGTLETIGVVGLFFSKTRKWSVMLFIIIMFGAAYTHISSAEFLRVIHNGIMVGISLLVMQLNQKLKRQGDSTIA
jgi:putative oxidoreductase